MANLGITDWNGSHYRIMGTLALTGLAVVGSGMEVDAQVWGALLTVSIALASELLRDRHRPYLLFLIAPLVAGAPMFFPAILITLLNMPLRYLPLPSFFYLSALSATAPSAVFTGIIGIALAALIHKLVALYTSAVDEYLHENDAHFEYERLLRQMEENRAREIASSTRESILAERNRIARSLHDYIGHTVSSAIMQLEAYKALYFTEDSPTPEDRNAEYRNVEDPSAEDPNAEDPSAEDPNAEDRNAENRNTECSNIREPHADSARAERLSEPSPSGAPPFAERSAAERLESVIDTLKSGMVDVRSGIHHLYDESLDLEMSIQRLAEKYPALRFRLIITNTESLRYQTKNEIFRMLCELVSNTVKHSDATQIRISVSAVGEYHTVSVKDNGSVSPFLPDVVPHVFPNVLSSPPHSSSRRAESRRERKNQNGSAGETPGRIRHGLGLSGIETFASSHQGDFDYGYQDGFFVHIRFRESLSE